MDRIQSAIEKARVQREAGGVPADAQAKPGPARRPQDRAQIPVADKNVAAAWAELPAFKPAPKLMQRNRIVTFEGGGAAAPFDMMRTKVLQQMRINNWRRLAITSPGSACGKTTLSLNLAFSLSRQGDERCALIEMDMRRPSMARTLGIQDQKLQFSKVLTGEGKVQDHLLRYGDNLAFGPCHDTVRNPSELLQAETTVAALGALDQHLGLTLALFDMPPMLACDDMLAFADNVDCVLLVAAAESSTIEQIDKCERELAEQTNVLGVVLNKCRYTENDTDYGYYD